MYGRRPDRWALVLGVLLVACLIWMQASSAVEESAQDDAATAAEAAATIPKPLSDVTTKGLEYLISQQHEDGGWGQGGGWRQDSNHGRREGDDVQDPSDLGNTCIATLALIRAGNTPQQGLYAKQVDRAAQFICRHVENSDTDSLYATDVRDTQLQRKIGQYVDTFLAGLVLSELKGNMLPGGSEQRLLAALDKTVKKIEKNQQADGTFAGNTGWASVLSQGLCSKFLNRAAQQKVAVSGEVLRRDYAQSVALLDRQTGHFKSVAAAPAAAGSGRLGGRGVAAGGDAGVQLYSTSSNASRISDFYSTNRALEVEAQSVLESKTATEAEKQQATQDLAQVKDAKQAQDAAVRGIVDRLDDKAFVAGFGNKGGEEFLSYMNISEMLRQRGGQDWNRWDQSVTSNLENIQNQDGSWSGQHCITGRTFCTATALLTLMADRAPVRSQPEGNK